MNEAYQDWLSDVAERWPVVSNEKLAEGTVVSVRRDVVRMPDGEEVGREVVEHPGAVGILAMDEAGQGLLIPPYRHPVGRQLWEIPARPRGVSGGAALATTQPGLSEKGGRLR